MHTDHTRSLSLSRVLRIAQLSFAAALTLTLVACGGSGGGGGHPAPGNGDPQPQPVPALTLTDVTVPAGEQTAEFALTLDAQGAAPVLLQFDTKTAAEEVTVTAVQQRRTVSGRSPENNEATRVLFGDPGSNATLPDGTLLRLQLRFAEPLVAGERTVTLDGVVIADAAGNDITKDFPAPITAKLIVQ